MGLQSVRNVLKDTTAMLCLQRLKGVLLALIARLALANASVLFDQFT